MVRKILEWLIFVLVAVFVGFVIWLFLLRTEPSDNNYSRTSRGEGFFPANTGTTETDNQNISDNPENQNSRNFIPRLRQLSAVPVSGGIAFERLARSSGTYITEDGTEQTSTSSVTIFRYIERATGHLYETREDTLTQTRLSNTTIPEVYEAKFAPDGDHLIIRTLSDDEETIKTLAGKITSKSTTSPETFNLIADGYKIEGDFLLPNVESIDITKDGLTYLVPNNNAEGGIIISDFDDLSKKLIFSSPVFQWVVQRISSNIISITSKADSTLDGFMYLINTTTGVDHKLIGDVSGLTTLSGPDNKWVLYSVSRENNIQMFALNMTTGLVFNTGLETLPEKCVFSQKDRDIVFCAAPFKAKNARYPEDWYQGSVTFNDNLWRINLEDREFDQILGDGEEINESFDMFNLVISPLNEYVLFINKKDLTLWSVDLTTIER
jgi:hypothetical protein